MAEMIVADIESGSESTKVREIISSHDIVIFSKTTCPFCFEMKRTLDSYGVQYSVFEVDKSKNMSKVQAALKEISGISTVPNLFVREKSYGGCTDLKAKELNGELDVLLAPFVDEHRAKSANINHISLFWFPETVNGRVVQLSGFFTCLYSIICVALYYRPWTKWAVLALALDFLARLLFGASASIIGMVSTMLTARLEPRWAAGPPKQFAALCGVFFSTFAAGLYLGGQKMGGGIVMACLAFAAGCEGFLDFCFGCWMFGLAIRFGIVPSSVYRPYLNMLSFRKFGYKYTHEKRNLPVVGNEHYLLPGQTEKSPVDLIRKDRLEFEYKLEDFSIVRHCTIDFFGIPMTFAALGYVFQLSGKNNLSANFNTGTAGQVMMITSVIVGGIFLIFYFVRFLFFPQKVIKEWRHPVYGNFFSTITITIILFGLYFLEKEVDGGITLIWIGAIGQLGMTMFRLSDLLYERLSEEHITPALMMSPVGNFIAAVGFSTYTSQFNGPDRNGEMNFLSVARLWFAVAALYAIVFFTITFRKAIHDHHSENRLRPTLWVWLATSSIAGPAYLGVSGGGFAVGTGVLYQSLWCISLMFVTILGAGWLRGFFNYQPDVSIWIVPFSLCAFAINTVQYRMLVGEDLFLTLAIIAEVIAATSTAVCTLHTLTWLFDGSLFTPKNKWGPVSFMKLTHEAFRASVPKFSARINDIDASNVNGVKRLIEDFEKFAVTFDEHSIHEDKVLFPRFRRYFPHINPSMDKDHEELHATLDKFTAAIKTYKAGGPAADLLSLLKADFATWGEQILQHLRNEENTATVVARKYFPLEYAIQITSEVFDTTSADNWRVVMPFVIEQLPIPQWKIRYVKTFVWANPARAQEIGLILYPNLDSVTWLLIAQEIPEIVPRGLPGFHRIY